MGNELTKRYYKIKEVSELLNVNQSTLRFWESEFPEIKPMRSETNRRYYTPSDIETLRIIKFLLKDKGLKIESAKEQLHLNRHNVTKRMKIIDDLINVKEELNLILKGLAKRK